MLIDAMLRLPAVIFASIIVLGTIALLIAVGVTEYTILTALRS